MEGIIKFMGVLLAVASIFGLIWFSGVLPFHHFHIIFDDGTEYHISALIDHNAENIIVYNFGAMYAIPINDRSFHIHYCNCGNSVTYINDIKEKEKNENLH